ncbi:MAG: gamma-glutamyl-gamma-aminobutyrate hydrolase family protein [Nocardioidaceae bacterium]
MTTPVIGLSTYREVARWGVWEQSADLLPTVYARAVEEAGGVPVLVPPPSSPGHAATAATVLLERLDALIVSGGADVAPARYGQEPHPRTTTWRDDRDAWELALLDAASATDIPILGVCRGMQVMAVHAGGELDQHVPDLVGHETHNPGGDKFGTTSVRVADGSRLAGMVGHALEVQCHHHQSVHTHPGFEAVAWSSEGLLEAMEAPGDRWRVGVQWHPEVVADAGLFQALVRAAAARVR